VSNKHPKIKKTLQGKCFPLRSLNKAIFLKQSSLMAKHPDEKIYYNSIFLTDNNEYWRCQELTPPPKFIVIIKENTNSDIPLKGTRL